MAAGHLSTPSGPVSLFQKRDSSTDPLPRSSIQLAASHFSSHTACLKPQPPVANEIALGVAAILGYARVGTTGQDPDAQLRALAAAGVDDEQTYTDKLSGVANTARPGLAALLDNAPDSDTVVVTID